MPVSCILLPSSADNTTLEVRWARSSRDILKAQKLRALAFGFSPPECREKVTERIRRLGEESTGCESQ